MTPPPEDTHDNVVSKLLRWLTAYLIETGNKGHSIVPRAAIWTSARTYLEPDLFYVSAELEARLKPKHRETADLVVEVISPGSAVYDRNKKAETYAALGVRELWLIDEAARTVEVRRQTGDGLRRRPDVRPRRVRRVNSLPDPAPPRRTVVHRLTPLPVPFFVESPRGSTTFRT